MDRVSGWYKRRSQWIILVLGLVAAIAVNADLHRYREAAIDQFQPAEFRGETGGVDDERYARAECQSTGRHGNPVDRTPRTQPRERQAMRILGRSLPARRPGILGNRTPPLRYTVYSNISVRSMRSVFRGPGLFAQKPGTVVDSHQGRTGLGWLITALAVSLGAPFWFDMLNKIMIVRSTVKPSGKERGRRIEGRETDARAGSSARRSESGSDVTDTATDAERIRVRAWHLGKRSGTSSIPPHRDLRYRRWATRRRRYGRAGASGNPGCSLLHCSLHRPSPAAQQQTVSIGEQNPARSEPRRW